MQDENSTQELERMQCSNKECTVEHDLKSYPTIKSLLVGACTVLPFVVALTFYAVNNAVSESYNKIQLTILPMKEKAKQNELRIVRVENSQIESQKTSNEILSIVRDIKTEMKYSVVKKDELKKKLDQKVDLDRINKQYLTK